MTYSCGYWVEHFLAGQKLLSDEDDVHKFLKKHFLHWLEALSWLGHLSAGLVQIQKLKSRIQVGATLWESEHVLTRHRSMEAQPYRRFWAML
jgi:hypothetical protein